MFLTYEMLEKLDACVQGKKWFKRYFPEGAELIDIINHKYTTYGALHWGFNHLVTSLEEQQAYWEKVKVDTPTIWTIYESDNITDSSYVSRSSHVYNSEYVFSSKEVTDCNSILSSDHVERSRQIMNSEFCYDSNKVFQGRNINNSHNIINSDYVVNSNCVINSSLVVDSFCIGDWLGRTSQITASWFVTNCKNMDHCLFCSQEENGKYLLFNKPIAPEQFELIKKQLASILRDWEPTYTAEEWPSEIIPMESPRLQRNPIKQYEHLPEAFWRWVTTLPNYDPTILYSITFNPQLL